MKLKDYSKQKIQYQAKESKILQPGDEIKIESNDYEWLEHLITTESIITIQIVIDEVISE